MAATRSRQRDDAPPPRRVPLDVIANALQRFAPLLAGASVFAFAVALVGLLAGLALAIALWRWQPPGEFSEYVQYALLAGLLIAPAVVLGLFALALREVSELPDRLRRLPENARRHSTNLGQIARDLRGIGGRRRGRARSLLGLGRLLYSARDDLLVYIPLVELVNPIFLLAVLVSFIAVGVEATFAAGLLGYQVVS